MFVDSNSSTAHRGFAKKVLFSNASLFVKVTKTPAIAKKKRKLVCKALAKKRWFVPPPVQAIKIVCPVERSRSAPKGDAKNPRHSALFRVRAKPIVWAAKGIEQIVSSQRVEKACAFKREVKVARTPAI